MKYKCKKQQIFKGLEFVTSKAGLTSINKGDKTVATITKSDLLERYFLCPVEQKIKSFKNYSEAKKEALKIWGDK